MANIDLFGTFLDKLSTVVESPDQRGSAARPLPGSATPDGTIRGDPVATNSIDAVYATLEASKVRGSDYVELSSLLPSANNSMASLLSALQQLETFGVIKRKGRNLIGLAN